MGVGGGIKRTSVFALLSGKIEEGNKDKTYIGGTLIDRSSGGA